MSSRRSWTLDLVVACFEVTQDHRTPLQYSQRGTPRKSRNERHDDVIALPCLYPACYDVECGSSHAATALHPNPRQMALLGNQSVTTANQRIAALRMPLDIRFAAVSRQITAVLSRVEAFDKVRAPRRPCVGNRESIERLEILRYRGLLVGSRGTALTELASLGRIQTWTPSPTASSQSFWSASCNNTDDFIPRLPRWRSPVSFPGDPAARPNAATHASGA